MNRLLSLSLLCVGLLGLGFAAGHTTARTTHLSAQQFVAQVQAYQIPLPCFASASAAQAYVIRLDDPSTPTAGTVQDGLEKGTAIPEGCFAVQTGLGGLATSYWRQPHNGVVFPSWNPAPDTNNRPM